MDVSWVISLLLGVPVAVLATLKISDWGKKHAAQRRAAHHGEQREGDGNKEEERLPSSGSADQGIAPIIRQAELAAAVERRIADELRHYDEAEHWH